MGALLRHGVNTGMANWLGVNFPWGTFTVNVLGSFLMGVLIATFAHFWQPPPEIKLLLITGFLGSFTTFSTFSLDFSVLYEGGRLETAMIYMAVSVLVSIGALFTGLQLVRALS